MRLAIRLALRDLRGGLTGLRLLAICLFLGVAALAGIASLNAAIDRTLSEQGQTILGGDIDFKLTQREADPGERAAIETEGRVSEIVSVRAMVSGGAGGQAILSELKAVDAAYPLFGRLAPRPKADEIALAPILAERLRVKKGDVVHIGEGRFVVAGTIRQEPDSAGTGFAFGPTAILSRSALAGTGLIQPGSLYETHYRVRLPSGIEPAPAIKRITARVPHAEWEIRDRRDGSPGTRRFIDRMGQFLSLVGLTALVVAGIGVGNGVASYLDGKRTSIATLKAMGATGRLIFQTYMLQILIVAAGGIVAGLFTGALLPWAISAVAGDALPVPPHLAIYTLPLLTSAAYGVLTAMLFAIAPLAQAKRIPAASLFRGNLGQKVRTGWQTGLATLGIGLLIAALAIGTAREPRFAAWFILAALGLLALLALLGASIQQLAAFLPRPAHPLARLALANLHRPGAQTGRLVVALGLGLSLFATLAVVETNLDGQMATSIPAKAPDFFLLDIPSTGIENFRTLVARQAPGARLVTVPSLRGPVVAVKGERVSDMKEIPPDAWILRGDRGLTYATTLPKGNRIVEGKWWPANYDGPPLVSIDVRAAKALKLRIGDGLTMSVLGVEIPARVASFREIDWGTMGLNFGIIFSPGALAGAPHSYLATIALPGGGDPAREAAFNRAVTHAFPSVSLIAVRDVIETLGNLVGQISTAVRAAASVAIAAGIAVLIGAIAAARQARIYDAVLLKLLGATRAQILAAQAMEYAALSLIVSIIALGVAGAGGWYVVTQVLDLQWAPDWPVVLATLATGTIVTLVLGLAGALPALAARPAQALREL